MKILRGLIISFLVSAQVARAQYAWSLTQSDTAEGHTFFMTKLSCFGNNCTAAGIDDNPKHDTDLFMFWRSNDGGKTWEEQNPHLSNLGTVYGFQIQAVQQIDSLNVVAVTDSGFMIRTYDAGGTWEKQTCNTNWGLFDVHFSDPMSGLAISYGPTPFHMTSDGGKHWINGAYHNAFHDSLGKSIVNGHSYGNGMYRAYRKPLGPIYTTYDSWNTYDSTVIVFDTLYLTTPDCFFYDYCNFSSGDTIMLYGHVFLNCRVPAASFIRSTDAGKTWSKPVFYHGKQEYLTSMTSLDRDTVLAGGFATPGYYLFSTDNGSTWSDQSFGLSTVIPIACAEQIGISGDGHPIAVYSQLPPYGSATIIIRGEPVRNKVDMFENIVWNIALYPNPAATTLNISSPDALKKVILVDILGRKITSATLSAQGKVQFDVSKFPRGIYSVVIDHDRKLIPVGSVSIGN